MKHPNYRDATKPITTKPTIILMTVAKVLSPRKPLTIYATIAPTNNAATPFILSILFTNMTSSI